MSSAFIVLEMIVADGDSGPMNNDSRLVRQNQWDTFLIHFYLYFFFHSENNCGKKLKLCKAIIIQDWSM